jgi:hypothetical protein
MFQNCYGYKSRFGAVRFRGDYRRHRCQEFYSFFFREKKILTTSFTFFICSVFHGWPDADRTVPFFKNFYLTTSPKEEAKKSSVELLDWNGTQKLVLLFLISPGNDDALTCLTLIVREGKLKQISNGIIIFEFL